jgi:hypothetical protein
MPASITYAKGAQNFTATVVNGFLNFSYEVVDNYNTDTSTGDSTTAYSYYLPADAVSLTLINNQDSGSAELFELSYQNVQISFSAGEYFDIINGTLLDVGAVYSLVSGALAI